MKNTRLLGIVLLCIVAVLIVSLKNSDTNNTEAPSVQKKESRLYTGIPADPIYSKSEIDLQSKNNRHIFEPALQGDTVEHDFILKNESDNPLDINGVKGCCGVILKSYTKQIPPNMSGKISIIIFTDKYGGKTIQGNILIDLTKQGQDISSEVAIETSISIEKFADISSHKIFLSGSTSQTIQESSFITPAENYPFKISGIKARKGLHIAYNFEETSKEGTPGYLINVRNTSKRPLTYRDILYIRTDNPHRPELRIRIQGNISSKEK